MSDLKTDVVMRGDCIAVLRSLPDACVDMVFADPPYHLGWVKQFLELWAETPSLLLPGGCLVLEHSKRESIPAGWGQPGETRVYGETLLTLFRS